MVFNELASRAAADIFGVRQNDCSFNAVGCLATEHVFEIFGWAIARLPSPWFRDLLARLVNVT